MKGFALECCLFSLVVTWDTSEILVSSSVGKAEGMVYASHFCDHICFMFLSLVTLGSMKAYTSPNHQDHTFSHSCTFLLVTKHIHLSSKFAVCHFYNISR